MFSLVTNTDEWKFFKETKKIRTPAERDLFHVENNGMSSLYLNSMETIHIPFKYDSFVNSHMTDVSNKAFEIKVIFKRSDTEEPLSILELLSRPYTISSNFICLVQSRRYAIENSFRWFNEENVRCVKLFRLHTQKRVAALRSTDPNILCSLRNAPGGGQELLITVIFKENSVIFLFSVMLPRLLSVESSL